VSLFQSVALVKRSSAPGQRVKGEFISGETTETPFRGTVQPPSGRVLQTLEEGHRLTDIIQVYAPIGLDFTPASSREQRGGDSVLWEGGEYTVIQAAKWNNGLLPHWVLLAELKKEGGVS
jgi:hypothetical protein